MTIGSRSPLRRLLAGLVAVGALFTAAACSPPAPAEPPPATVVLSRYSGPAGTTFTAAAPNRECGQMSTLYPNQPGYYPLYNTAVAGITIPATGVVITTAYTNLWNGSSPSTYAESDQLVHLRIPPATRAGTYKVFLTCSGYLDTYAFTPATFTVTG
ncbi:MAG: hypothetical protein R2698_13430 [Microthrixaceae bacterium]